MLQQSAQLDAIYHALADAGRRAMLDRLSRGPATVSELAAPLDMTLSAVVQHLKVLETSGLVTTQKVGRVRTCLMDPKALSLAEKWLRERRTLWHRRLGDAPASDPGGK
jgi:DNA-binding transcriptional ArsR family regulator